MTPHLFTLTGNQRSGTTLVRQLISSLGIYDAGEIFHADFLNNDDRFFEFVRLKASDEAKLIHPFFHEGLFECYLDRLVSQRGSSAIIDIKYNALRLLDFGKLSYVPVSLKILRKKGAKFIHVIRKNKLRQIVSERVAQASGIWAAHSTDNLQFYDKRIYLEPDRIEQLIYEQEILTSDVSSYIPEATKVIYEDIFEGDGRFTKEFTNSLGLNLGLQITHRDYAHVTLTKQNPEPLEEIITNFAEIEKALANTPYLSMLYDRH